MSKNWRNLTHSQYLRLEADGKLTQLDFNDPKTKEFLVDIANKNRQSHLDSIKVDKKKV